MGPTRALFDLRLSCSREDEREIFLGGTEKVVLVPVKQLKKKIDWR